jgi:hypothetical protein
MKKNTLFVALTLSLAGINPIAHRVHALASGNALIEL